MAVPRPPGRALHVVVAVLLVVAFAVAAERGEWLRALRAGGDERTWIWAPVELRDVRPRAFFAAAEFELAGRPARAELEVLGDEEYVAWLNGRRIGSGRFRTGMPLDRYDVARFLRAGANRVVLELRSATGAGGATLRLTGDDGRSLLESGAHWSVYEHAWRGLLDSDPMPAAPGARVIGRSPIGRWGVPAPGPLRPVQADLFADQRPERAGRYRLPLESGLWFRLPRLDARRPPLGPLVEFDFGREVTGFLVLAVRDRQTATGLVRFGTAPSGSSGWVPDVIAVVPPHRGSWQAAEPARFRFVEVAGLERVLSAAVLTLAPGFAPVPAPAPAAGLLGIPAPPLRRPVEDAIWRSLRNRSRVPPLEPLNGVAVRPSG